MKYPIGIQTFSEIVKNGYVYVDKTDYVYKLAHTNKYNFVSRPRRFGKSLLLSTLKSYFEGEKYLFRGLAIETLEHDWIKYPVLRFDLNAGSYNDIEGLTKCISYQLTLYERVYGVDVSADTLQNRFRWLIESASRQTGRNVVILIDEYDKPLLEAVGNKELQNAYRAVLKPFYGILKTCDENIRFAMLTGVTKYSHLSVFSDLNNIKDLSIWPEYAAICGITKDEIHRYFPQQIQLLAERLKVDTQTAEELLREKYDGYRFSKADVKVFNPYSLLNALQEESLDNFWFQTGTPSYLVKLLQIHSYRLNKLEGFRATADTLMNFDTDSKSPIPVIYQSGYLTIRDYDPESNMYTLGYPNREVREGFLTFLLPIYCGTTREDTGMTMEDMLQDLRLGNVDSMMERLESLFADTPYSTNKDYEFYYQDIIYTVFRLLGERTYTESHTARGRCDIVVKTSDYIYVMEFKFDGTAQKALDQIIDRGYAEPYAADHREKILIGINFSERTHNIDKWAIRKMP